MARPPADRLALLAMVLLGAVLTLTTARPAMPPFLPMGDYRAYDAETPAAVVALDPMLHAPWFGARYPALALVAATAVLLMLWQAARQYGAGPWLAAAVALAFALRPDLGVPVALGAPAMLATALAWLVVAASTRGPWIRTRGDGASGSKFGSSRAVMLCAAAGVSTLLWPPIVVVMPVLAGRTGDAVGWRAGVGAIAVALVGGAVGLAAWSRLAAAAVGGTVGVADVVTAIASGHSTSAAYPWPPMSVALLPVALAVVGLVSAATAGRRPWATTLGAVATVGLAAWLTPWRAESIRAVVWTCWPAVAAGLVWTGAQAPAAHRRLATATLATALVASGGLARVRQTDLVEPAQFAANVAASLAPLERPLTFVAEDPRLDTALVGWGGDAVRRVLPHPAAVAAAMAAGRRVYAAPGARSALEMHGVRFRPGPAVTAPMPFAWAEVAGAFGCTTVGPRWSELSGVEYTGRLGLHLPAGDGQLEVVVAGHDTTGVRLATADGRQLGAIVSGAARGLDDLPPVLWPGDGRLPPPETVATRITVPAARDYAIHEALTLGARAPAVAVRMRGSATPARVCAAPLPRFDPFDVEGAARVGLQLTDAAYFGSGFHAPEGAAPRQFRWSGATAAILIPASRARQVTLEIEARAAATADGGPVLLTATINGVALAPRVMDAGPTTYAWPIAAHLWVDGTNELTLAVSRTASAGSGGDPRTRGLALHALRLIRQ